MKVDKPKICVPIIDKTQDEIFNTAREIKVFLPDIVEWRVDWFEDFLKTEKVIEVLKELRNILSSITILFTFRTLDEGGNKAISDSDYKAVNIAAIESGCADIVDVEIDKNKNIVENIIDEAHRNGIQVIGSNHNFKSTPDKKDIINKLNKIDNMGGDILKMAVMPNDKKDVVTLLNATFEVSMFTKKPVVTMSMGELGKVTRITGGFFGSKITFATVKEASAPGQIYIKDLRKIFETIYE